MPPAPQADKVPAFRLDRVALCLLKNSTDALIGVDPQGMIQVWNASAEKICGYSPAEMNGKNIQLLFANDDEGKEGASAEDKLRSGVPTHGWETRLLHKDGSIVHASIEIWPLSTDTGAAAGACFSARGTAKYRMLEKQLRQTQKLETMGRLSGGIAHDFNNLLTVISGYSNMIREELPKESELWEWATEVEKAAEKATTVTNQLLAFSRREITVQRPLNLNEMVQDVHTMLRRILGEDIKISLLLEPKIRNVKADPGQLSQMLTNLIVNARDAMSHGGTLRIETRSAHFDEPLTNHGPELPPGDYVQITVGDTGIGMDQATQEHLFEPFFTTKAKGKGTGLGLSIVYGIVSQLRGSISVESSLGKGTTFTIYLPSTTERAAEKLASTTLPRQPAPPDIAILVVEDDADVRHLARYMLLKLGYTVYETADPREAIRIAATIHIDVLLTDIVMPEMNGVDLAVSVLRSCPHIKVVYMSGYLDDSIVPPSYLEPTISFIRKPFTARRLQEQIMSVFTADGEIRLSTVTACAAKP